MDPTAEVMQSMKCGIWKGSVKRPRKACILDRKKIVSWFLLQLFFIWFVVWNFWGYSTVTWWNDVKTWKRECISLITVLETSWDDGLLGWECCRKWGIGRHALDTGLCVYRSNIEIKNSSSTTLHFLSPTTGALILVKGQKSQCHHAVWLYQVKMVFDSYQNGKWYCSLMIEIY